MPPTDDFYHVSYRAPVPMIDGTRRGHEPAHSARAPRGSGSVCLAAHEPRTRTTAENIVVSQSAGLLVPGGSAGVAPSCPPPAGGLATRGTSATPDRPRCDTTATHLCRGDDDPRPTSDSTAGRCDVPRVAMPSLATSPPPAGESPSRAPASVDQCAAAWSWTVAIGRAAPGSDRMLWLNALHGTYDRTKSVSGATSVWTSYADTRRAADRGAVRVGVVATGRRPGHHVPKRGRLVNPPRQVAIKPFRRFHSRPALRQPDCHEPIAGPGE
jgi:hypothetical protein